MSTNAEDGRPITGSTTAEPTLSLPESRATIPIERSEPLAAWLQFPRRLVLLLIAFGLAQALLSLLKSVSPVDLRAARFGPVDWTRSLVSRQPVEQVVGSRLPDSLYLLGAALFLALALAAIFVLLALLARRLQAAQGLPRVLGHVIAAVGRLSAFGWAAVPVYALAMFLIFVFAVSLKLLPPAGGPSPSGLGDGLPRLVLPAMALAALPAVLTARTTIRELTRPDAANDLRTWLAGPLRGLAALLGQVSGLITALVFVEYLFGWPGLGQVSGSSALLGDRPVLWAAVSVFVVIVLVGRLAAEFLDALARLVQSAAPATPQAPARQPQTFKTVIALLLLLVPLSVAAAGLATGEQDALRSDLSSRSAAPSSAHPLGTDSFGRDVRARVLQGALNTLEMTVLTALLVLIVSLVGGGLTGYLASRGTWGESLADLLLLPADIFLLVPALPAALLLSVLLPHSVVLLTTLVLWPRGVKACQALWSAALGGQPRARVVARSTGALLLGILFAAWVVVAGLDLLGLGAQPPAPALGMELGNGIRYIIAAPLPALAAGIVLSAIAFAFFAASILLVAPLRASRVLVRLNE